jgi:hypothetical protein
MEDYQHLVQEFEQKQIERSKFCDLKRIDASSLDRRSRLPVNIHTGKLLYLGYGRNAWQSTWINRYYPGSIAFFEKDLQERCEKLRVQGSVFRIETVPVVYLEYHSDVVALVAINDRSSAAYRPMLENILPFRLDAFWSSDEFKIDNWLIPFQILAWRPDLHPKNFHRMTSSPKGGDKPLHWERHEADKITSGICDAFSQFMPNLLKIN